MGLLEKTAIGFAISNLFASLVERDSGIVKPKVGSVVRIGLVGGATHSGIYIGKPIFGLFGKERIVEITNINGFAVVRRVSMKEFITGDGFWRSGKCIYVACKRDRNGNCVAMGSKDIAKRAKASVNQVSNYNLIFNNCHMFTEYCITGEKPMLPGTLWSVEKALNRRFIQQSDERLPDMWRSTGITQ